MISNLHEVLKFNWFVYLKFGACHRGTISRPTSHRTTETLGWILVDWRPVCIMTTTTPSPFTMLQWCGLVSSPNMTILVHFSNLDWLSLHKLIYVILGLKSWGGPIRFQDQRNYKIKQPCWSRVPKEFTLRFGSREWEKWKWCKCGITFQPNLVGLQRRKHSLVWETNLQASRGLSWVQK